MRRFKVSLVLGGGGVRGFSHIGVLKVLEENRIPIDFIVGVSMGAIVGAVYCLYKDINLLEEKAKEIIDSDQIKGLEEFVAESEPEEKKTIIKRLLDSVKDIYLWHRIRIKKWIADSEMIRNIVSRIIPEDKSFSDLKIPFFCVATDILSGEEVILREGNLLNAVLASSSIPGIFEPVKIGKRLLVDGGITSLVPSMAAERLGADFIVGVNVEGLRLRDNLRGGIDILFQADQITAHYLNKRNLSKCDLVIQPKVSHLSWADFSKAQFCIEEGEKETEKILPELKKTMRKKRLRTLFKRLF